MSIKDSKLANLIDPSDFPQSLVMYSDSGNRVNFNPQKIDEACRVLETMNTDWYWEIDDLKTIKLRVQFFNTQIESELGEYYNIGDIEVIMSFYFRKIDEHKGHYHFRMERARAFSAEANMFSVQGHYHPHANGGSGDMCFGDTGMSEIYADLTHDTFVPEKLSHFLFELGSWVAYESSSTGPYINFNDEVGKLVSRHSGTPTYNNTPANLEGEIRKFIADIIHDPHKYSKRKKTLSKLFFVQANYEFVSKLFIQYLQELGSARKAVLKGNNVLVKGIQRSGGERTFVTKDKIDVSRVMGDQLYFTRSSGKLKPPRMTMDVSDQLTTVIHPSFYRDIKMISREMFTEALRRNRKDPIVEYKEKVNRYIEELDWLEEQSLTELGQMETA